MLHPKEIKLSSVYIPKKEHICLPKVSLGYIRTRTTLILSERYHLRHDSRPNERKRAWSSWTLPQIKPPTLPWMPAPLGHCSLGECKGCAPHPCGIAPRLPVKNEWKKLSKYDTNYSCVAWVLKKRKVDCNKMTKEITWLNSFIDFPSKFSTYLSPKSHNHICEIKKSSPS